MKDNKKWYKENILNYNNNINHKENQSKYKKINNNIISKRINISITLLIVLIFLVFLLFFYKPKSIDILKDLKNTFIYGMIIILGIMIILIILSNFIVKEKNILSNILKIILLFNIIFLILFICIEANLNQNYNNKEKFGELYDTKIQNKEDKEYIDIWNSLLTLSQKTKTEREIFIEENMSQYIFFRIKTYLILILYVITMMLNTILISKIDKEIKGKEVLKKYDKILFKN